MPGGTCPPAHIHVVSIMIPVVQMKHGLTNLEPYNVMLKAKTPPATPHTFMCVAGVKGVLPHFTPTHTSFAR